MTDIDIDAIRRTPMAAEPGNNTFVVWYDPNNEPYAVYFRSDTNAWGDQRWFNADQRESDGEPSTWDDLCEDLLGNDGPHLLAPGAKVDELTAALAEAREQAATAAKRIDGLRDYILGALDEDDPLTTEEMRNASIDLASALADLGHPVAAEDEDEDEAPRRPIVTVELPTEVTR